MILALLILLSLLCLAGAIVKVALRLVFGVGLLLCLGGIAAVVLLL